MLRCREVVQLIASDGLTDASRWRRLMLRLHLATCRHCRAYARQVRSLGTFAREIWSRDGEDAGAISRIEATLTRRIGSEEPGPGRPPGDLGSPTDPPSERD